MKLQLQTLPGIWISELGMMAWMSLDALGLKYSYMHCICTCRHPHTELVLSGTGLAGQSAISFNQHPCKGCSQSPDTALGENGLEFTLARSFEFRNYGIQEASVSLCSHVSTGFLQKQCFRNFPVVQGAYGDRSRSNLQQSLLSVTAMSLYVTTVTDTGL